MSHSVPSASPVRLLFREGRERSHRAHMAISTRGDDRVPLSLQLLATLLGGVAVTMLAVVQADGSLRTTGASWLVAQLSLMAVGGWAMRRLSRQWQTPPSVSPLLILLAVGPLVWEPVRRSLWGVGIPFEILTMSVLRNIVIGLAILCPWHRFHPLCLSMSLFLVLFGVVASADPATRVLAGLFAAGAIGWLTASHWNDVRQRLDSRQSVGRPRWGLVAVLVVAIAGLLRVSGGDRVIRSTAEGWLASSGGTGQRDPFSRDGVGDGEMLVAGSERIQSFAPIENAPFVSDHQPSLYDVFDDTYEEPVQRPKEQDRAIGLPPELAARVKEHLHARTEKAHREFSTMRRSPSEEKAQPVESILSEALFHVAGRVPLHLRMQPYDLFDGVDWFPESDPEHQFPLRIANVAEKPWLSLPDRMALRPYLSEAESHAIKVVKLETNVIPAPLYAHGYHIDRVDREDMFAWGPGGLIRMARKELPRLVAIHVASRAVDVKRIGSELSSYSALGPVYRNIPTSAEPEKIRELANAWTRGIPRGWGQVEAIRLRIRQEYTLDPAARPSADADSPVDDFLFRGRRGPDYQFATASALLLRSLGYCTRVVSGFYADPERYDHDSRHTPVLASDVHFWTEVNVAGGDWLTVEPCPGYDLLGPPPSLGTRVAAALHAGLSHLREQGFLLGSLALLLALAGWQWRRLFDGIDTLRWRFSRQRGGERHLLATLRLIERRCTLAGQPRPVGTTIHAWLGHLSASGDKSLTSDLRALGVWIDRSSYSRDGRGLPEKEIQEVGERVAQALTLSRLLRGTDRTRIEKHLAS